MSLRQTLGETQGMAVVVELDQLKPDVSDRNAQRWRCRIVEFEQISRLPFEI